LAIQIVSQRKPPISLFNHLVDVSKLTNAGLITQEKRGRVKWCKLEPDAMREASIWMQGFGQMGGLDLDAFEAFLAQELPS